MTMYDEGVIKFNARHEDVELSARQYGDLACKLVAWRGLLVQTQLVGQDPNRYGGAGYGNVSGRVGAPSASLGERSFLITGTQTGGAPCMNLDDFALVSSYNYQDNSVDSAGLTQPSSEAMTHGAIFDCSPHIRFVFHGHCPVIWQQSSALRIPTTEASVPYGTPEMAKEVQRLYRDSTMAQTQVMSMGGHEDGVIVFGRTPEEAGQIFLTVLAKAYERVCGQSNGGLCIT